MCILRRYVYKGPDRAMVALRTMGDVDEIALFQDVRSFGSAEGCWRTFDFEMSGRAPPIVRLPVHLEGRQNCRYEEGTERETVSAGAPATELTAWFAYTKAHPEARQPIAARAMTDASPAIEAWSAKYSDFPERYRFDDKKKAWQPRKKMDAFGYIGRVYHVHHGAGEAYYLRMLLHHVPACDLALAAAPADESAAAAATRVADAFSFEALKYHEGVKLETYKGVCSARGLLQDDREWDDLLADACVHTMPPAMRRLFVYVLAFNQPLDPMALFESYYADMGDDYARQLDVARGAAIVRARVLLDLEERLARSGHTLADANMAFTDEERELAATALQATARSSEPKEIQDELPEDLVRVQAAFDEAYAELLPSQREAVDAALAAIESGTGLGLFLDAPGGTGKTFSANCLLNAVRAKGEIALAVASSGIAAILLELGRTFHSRCKASLKPAADQFLNISAQSVTAELFRRAKLILWDEGAMGNRYHLEALDLTLRDLMKTVDASLEHVPFGGKVIVIGGDFRQTLPVVPRASRSQILDVTLTHSRLWAQHFAANVYQLSENMRIVKAAAAGADTDELREFAAWLLRLGDGTEPHDALETITLPTDRWPELCEPTGADVDKLSEWVYPGLLLDDEPPTPELLEQQAELAGDAVWLSQRAILTPLNVTVDAINDSFTDSFPGAVVEVHSADRVSEADGCAVSVEFLNTINLPNFPAHVLRLKEKMPLMLLRNLSPPDGLCNGTRLILLRVINKRLLLCQIATGKNCGDIVEIPRLTLDADEDAFPFSWSRRQFPVRVAFAMTINKAQGQTLQRVGVYLPEPCFTHGQLYVAASRVGLPTHLRFAVPRDEATGAFRTRNVVFREALTS